MSKISKINPENFEQECSTVWSFARRGKWATHNSKYRGNWAPEVVRNLILRYSKEKYCLLDPMIGGGTTAIECKLLNHPPYVDIIKYSQKQIEGDLSNIHDLNLFCDEIEKAACEFYRVLKKDKYCAVLIGDARRNKMYQPLAFKVM